MGLSSEGDINVENPPKRTILPHFSKFKARTILLVEITLVIYEIMGSKIVVLKIALEKESPHGGRAGLIIVVLCLFVVLYGFGFVCL